MAYCRTRLSLFLLTFLALSATFAFAAENIQVTVDATKTQQKFLRTHLTMPVKAGELTLYYPKWIPGEHGPNGPISDLAGLKFEGGGKTIPWKRDLLDVFTFHLEIPSGVSQLEATYDYIEPDGESATDKLTVLEWNAVLLYPAGIPAEQLNYEATLLLPEGWKFGTSLPIAHTAANKITFKPISLDLLVDSPVIAGEFYRAIDVTPAGEPVPHELDLVADSEAALEISPDVQKAMTNLVAESGKLFGARHYRDYHFLLTLSDHVAHFGLEHHESNDSRLPERRFLLGPEAGYMGSVACSPMNLCIHGMESFAALPTSLFPTTSSRWRPICSGVTKDSRTTSARCWLRAAAYGPRRNTTTTWPASQAALLDLLLGRTRRGEASAMPA